MILSLLFSLFLFQEVEKPQPKATVVFVLDDLGNDILPASLRNEGYERTEGAAQMPFLESLALHRTDLYTMPACSPTRASILSGQIPAFHRIGEAIKYDGPKVQLQPGRSKIDEWWPYHTRICFGKWHLSNKGGGHPLKCGFNYYSGPKANMWGDYYDPEKWRWDSADFEHLEPESEGEHLLNYSVREFRRVMNKFPKEDLFILYNLNTPHSPYQAPPKLWYYTEEASPYVKLCEASDQLMFLITQIIKETHNVTDMRIFSDNGTPAEFCTSERAKGTTFEAGIRTTLFSTEKIEMPYVSVLDVLKPNLNNKTIPLAVSQKIKPIGRTNLSEITNGQFACIYEFKGKRYKYQRIYRKPDELTTKDIENWYQLEKDSFVETKIDPDLHMLKQVQEAMKISAMRGITD